MLGLNAVAAAWMDTLTRCDPVEALGKARRFREPVRFESGDRTQPVSSPARNRVKAYPTSLEDTLSTITPELRDAIASEVANYDSGAHYGAGIYEVADEIIALICQRLDIAPPAIPASPNAPVRYSVPVEMFRDYTAEYLINPGEI